MRRTLVEALPEDFLASVASLTEKVPGSSNLGLTRHRLAWMKGALKIPGKMTREWLRSIGAKGGAKKGTTKKRGDAAYYRKLRERRFGK